jgi:hypothetical protein
MKCNEKDFMAQSQRQEKKVRDFMSSKNLPQKTQGYEWLKKSLFYMLNAKIYHYP